MMRRRILGLTVWPPLALPEMAQAALIAETAGLDFLRFPDIAALGKKHEALALVAALSTMTSRIGLVPGASLDFNDPYNLARALATLDYLADGRIGWEGMTCVAAAEAQNFGHDGIEPTTVRRGRARELLEVVGGLHDSWDDDAVPRDKASGVFFDRAGMRILSHAGALFRVHGPLDVPTSPQRHLPLFARPDFPEIAERYADVLIAGDSNELAECAAIRARSRRDIRILMIAGADDRALSAKMRDETVDGVMVACSDVGGFVRDVLPGLGHQPHSGGTLREVLGLAPARSRYEESCSV